MKNIRCKRQARQNHLYSTVHPSISSIHPSLPVTCPLLSLSPNFSFARGEIATAGGRSNGYIEERGVGRDEAALRGGHIIFIGAQEAVRGEGGGG